jgi:hypothetical protein
MLRRHLCRWDHLDDAGIGNHNVERSVFRFDGRVQFVQVGQICYDTLYDRDVLADDGFRFFQFRLTATGNEYIRSFFREPSGR